jgi:hypothetical protein
MSLPSVLTTNLKDANRAQRVYMQTVAAHAFFRNFIAEIYGYTIVSVGLGVAKGVIPEMLLDDGIVTTTHPGDGKVYSLLQLNRRLRSQAESVLGPNLMAFPVSRTDPLFQHQREHMAEAWGTPIEFCNTYANLVARGIDNRYMGSRETRDAVIASSAYSAYQYLFAMLPAFVDRYATAEEFVDSFISHANDPDKDTASWSWPVTFNNALLQTLFKGAEFGDPMELYRIYSNLVNTQSQNGERGVDVDTIKDALMFTALGRVTIGPAV